MAEKKKTQAQKAASARKSGAVRKNTKDSEPKGSKKTETVDTHSQSRWAGGQDETESEWSWAKTPGLEGNCLTCIFRSCYGQNCALTPKCKSSNPHVSVSGNGVCRW